MRSWRCNIETAQPRSELLPYPVDLLSLLTVPIPINDAGAFSNVIDKAILETDQTTSIAYYALAHWNAFLKEGEDEHKKAFLMHANWLLLHETCLANGAGGWPLTCALPDYHVSQPWLSALMQGCAVSILVRAYQLTREEVFRQSALRAVHAFELDILDGGVHSPIGEFGVFFEEVAVYPAAHILKGHILALIGLYDYMMIVEDSRLEVLIEQSMAALHGLIDEYDTGYWTYHDLLHKHLASRLCHSLHVVLLEALAKYSGCEHCMTLVSRWYGYERHFGCRLRYLISSHVSAFLHNKLKPNMQRLLFDVDILNGVDEIKRKGLFSHVCIPIIAFPVPGGMRTVLTNVAEVMSDQWQMVYLTHHKGSGTEGLEIETFGRKVATPWQFPFVWLYGITGLGKLFALLRRNRGYDLILPQDGVFTGAFAALVGKLAGVRVVCIDHGNLALLDSRMYRDERLKALSDKHWIKRVCTRFLYIGYWPSLYLLARIAARFVDHYFIPGVAGDGTEDVLKQLGVHSSRITRFANMIDIKRHVIPDAKARADSREKLGITADAIVIAIICRLAPEKGLEIAIEAISQALSALSPDVGGRIRIIIAGHGPLRKQLEGEIHSRGLVQICLFWGEASPLEVINILGLSDIFLFTSWRAAGYPLTVLEAMASGCAVIASTESLANQEMLAEGRGIVLPVGDANGTARAIVKLVSDPELYRQMGSLAKNYVAIRHNADVLRRSLLRVTRWSSLNEMLSTGMENEG